MDLQLIPMPASLEEVRVKSLPSSAFYIADFINREEETFLLDQVSGFAAFEFLLIIQGCSSSETSMEAAL